MKKIVFSLTFILILVMTFNLRNESFAISADILSEIHLESKNPPAPPPEPDHSGGGGGYNPEYNNDTDKNEEEDEEQDDDGDDENGDGENGEKEEIPADTWETIQHPEVYNAGFSGRIYEDAKHLDSATGIEIVDGTYRIPVDAKITIGRKESWGDSYSLSLSDEFPAGTYTITVEYGVPNPILKGNTGYIKRQLRYNAQDFYINERQGIRKFVNSYVRDIQISGKGCIQMMLVIDASGSMTDTDNLVDGIHTRLEKQIDAAKTLVNNLLTDKNENLYIGIVAFAYESNLIQPLTYKRDKVIDSLNKLSESAKNPENYSGGTNIYGAIDQANNSFVYSGEDSNRMMVLLSDGLPIFTGTDIDEPYYEEDLEDGEAERKLNNVKAKTEEKMQEVRSSGVNLSAIIVETNDPWENGRIVDLCKNGCGEENYSVVTDDDAISRIEDGIKDSVIESQLENIDFEKTEEYYQKMFESPYNNSSYFNTFTNDNTKIFDVINNYDGTDVAFQDALKLSEKTKGSVSFTYTLDNKPDQRVYAKDVKSYDEFSEEQRKYNHTLHGEHPEDAYDATVAYVESSSEDETIITTSTLSGDIIQKDEYFSVPVYLENQNIGLAEKPQFQTNLKVNVTGVKVELQNGQDIIAKMSENCNFIDRDLFIDNDDETKSEVREIRDIDDVMLYYVDNNLLQGARLCIEYTITLKNALSYIVTDAKIADYLPNDLTFSPDEHLITTYATNDDYGWHIENINGKSYPVTSISQSSAIRAIDGKRYIGTNGERYIKVVLSKALTTKGLEDAINNEVEICEYSNNGNRRMTKEIQAASSINYLQLHPADHDDQGYDYNISGSVTIIPPTGVGISYKRMELVVAVFVMFASVVIFRKFNK